MVEALKCCRLCSTTTPPLFDRERSFKLGNGRLCRVDGFRRGRGLGVGLTAAFDRLEEQHSGRREVLHELRIVPSPTGKQSLS